jgi:hypothetical protein
MIAVKTTDNIQVVQLLNLAYLSDSLPYTGDKEPLLFLSSPSACDAVNESTAPPIVPNVLMLVTKP